MVAGKNDDAKLAGAFRPDRRPFLIMVAANALLAGLFLGYPWLRERSRTTEARADFARFAACLYGGEAKRNPGLGLPSGDTAHFAFQALRAEPTWPGRCRASLLAVAPEEARFLLPSAAAAEHEVRRAVDLVRRELDGFDVERATATRVTTRPLRAIALLRASLAKMVEASGFEEGVRDDALRFGVGAALVEPTRLPIRASADARLYVEARGDGLAAFALDTRGLGSVRLGAGRVELLRVARPPGVQGFVHGPSASGGANTASGTVIPWLVSITSEARCLADEFRCARRAMGIAPIEANATAAPAPFQLAAHPWGGAIDDAVRVLGPSTAGGAARLAVLARTVDAGPELRVFVLDGDPAPPAQIPPTTDAPASTAPIVSATRSPSLRQPLELGVAEVRAAQLLPDGRPVLLVTADEVMHAVLFDAAGQNGRVVGEVPGVAGGWLRACTDASTTWIALGSAEEAHLVRAVDATQAAVVGDHVVLAAGESVDAVRTVVSCDARGALLVAPLTTGGARLLACGEPDDCRVGALADLPRTAVVAAARDDGVGIVAYSVRNGRVHVVRVDARAHAIGASVIPAACWDDGTGLCGAPSLASRNGRTLLVTREGSDLRALETVDRGATWGTMRGLR